MLFLALLCFCAASAAAAPLPVVLWHGLGDYYDSSGMLYLSSLIRNHTNSFVHSIRFSNSSTDDQLDSFFKPASEQIPEACATLSALPQLTGGFNMLGFSQGGQFLRALVQTCANLTVHNLITLGGQHQGVFGLPNTCDFGERICEDVRKLLDIGVYNSFVQHHLVPANYWKDADDEHSYLMGNLWQPNVLENASATQTTQLSKLNKFVMVLFQNDTVVVPRISSHFGWLEAGSDSVQVNFTNTSIYRHNVLGKKSVRFFLSFHSFLFSLFCQGSRPCTSRTSCAS
jgi:palmitoyl-protein thioesterase